jgi:hypothetical protein
MSRRKPQLIGMVRIQSPWGWSKDITPEAYEAAKAVIRAPSCTHWKIWRALVDAGTPIRGNRDYPASQAASALSQPHSKVEYV